MAFHLESPALTMTGKKKGKKKFASSALKQKSLQLAEEWQQMQKDWAKLTPKFNKGAKPKTKVPQSNIPALTPPPGRESSAKIPSLNSWVTGTVSSKPNPKYTGTAILGIAVQHKSCLQPIFSESAAKDSASMRR